MKFPKICRHCNRRKVTRPRGLCFPCYYAPTVRDRYPSVSKFGRRFVGDFCGLPPLPCWPTSAMPGSDAKIEVLALRARSKQSLWHPQDAGLVDTGLRKDWAA